jgi:hypothetical protein
MRTAAAVLGATLLLAGCGAGGGPVPATYTDPPATPPPTPLPRADEADSAVRAFGALIARGDLSFHVLETVTTTGGAVSAAIDLDVAGSDFAATIKVKGAKPVELRHVGAVTFARSGNGKWRSGTADERLLDEVTNPWLFLCWLDDLEYTGPAADVTDGLTFSCSRSFTYQSLTMRAQGKTGRIESLTLVLTADGSPRRMELSGSGPTLATDRETFAATFVFSRVGEPIVVKVPKG